MARQKKPVKAPGGGAKAEAGEDATSGAAGGSAEGAEDGMANGLGNHAPVPEGKQSGKAAMKSNKLEPKTPAKPGVKPGPKNVSKNGVKAAAKAETEEEKAEAAAKAECEKALQTFRRGNPQKAVKLIVAATEKYTESAQVHKICGYIHRRLAEPIDDKEKNPMKVRNVRTAIAEMERATKLRPRSLEFAISYANLMYEATPESEGYEKVVEECRRAMNVEDPLDPAEDVLGVDQWPTELRTKEARIERFREQLRELHHKAQLSGLGSILRTLHMDSDRGFMQTAVVRKLSDDALEQRVLQPKRPNEVKKSPMSVEERRRQIEAQVEAARLLQKQKDFVKEREQNGGLSKKEEEGAVEDEKDVKEKERKKGKSKEGSMRSRAKEGRIAEERIKRVRPFWDDRSVEERKELLQVPIPALIQRLKAFKMTECHSILTEGLDYNLKTKGNWRFWICHRCGDRFSSEGDHKDHLLERHITLPPEVQVFKESIELPEEKLLAVDGPAVVKKMIEDLVPPENKKSACSDGSGEQLFVDAKEQIPGVGSADSASDRSERSGSLSSRESSPDRAYRRYFASPTDMDGLFGEEGDRPTEPAEVGCPTHGLNGCPQPLAFEDEWWPVSDDSLRQEVLKETFRVLKHMIGHRHVFVHHVREIFNFLAEKLQEMVPESLKDVLVQWPADWRALRLLKADDLRTIIAYLDELVPLCGPEEMLVEEEGVVVEQVPVPPEEEVVQQPPQEEISIWPDVNEDRTKLVLSDRLADLLSQKGEPSRSKEAEEKAAETADCSQAAGDKESEKVAAKGPSVADTEEQEEDKSNVTASGPPEKEGGEEKGGEDNVKGGGDTTTVQPPAPEPVGAEAQLGFLYDLEEEIAQREGKLPTTWEGLKKDGKQKGEELSRELRQHSEKFKEVMKKQQKLQSLDQSLKAVEDYVRREMRKRGPHMRMDVILLKHGRDLVQELALLDTDRPRYRSRAQDITQQKEAVDFVLRRSQHVKFPRQIPRRSLHSDSDDDEEAGIVQTVITMNSRVEKGFESARKGLKEQAEENEKEEAQLLRSITSNFARISEHSCFDYRHALLPMVKQFIQGQLETAVAEDAIKKSDAAREAFLAELEQDESSKATEQPKQAPKSKDKKKKDKKKEAKKAVPQPVLQAAPEASDDEEEVAPSEAKPEVAPDPFEALRAAEVEEEERQLARQLERQRLEEMQLAERKRLRQRGQLLIGDEHEGLTDDPDELARMIEEQRAIENEIAASRGATASDRQQHQDLQPQQPPKQLQQPASSSGSMPHSQQRYERTRWQNEQPTEAEPSGPQDDWKSANSGRGERRGIEDERRAGAGERRRYPPNRYDERGARGGGRGRGGQEDQRQWRSHPQEDRLPMPQRPQPIKVLKEEFRQGGAQEGGPEGGAPRRRSGPQNRGPNQHWSQGQAKLQHQQERVPEHPPVRPAWPGGEFPQLGGALAGYEDGLPHELTNGTKVGPVQGLSFAGAVGMQNLQPQQMVEEEVDVSSLMKVLLPAPSTSTGHSIRPVRPEAQQVNTRQAPQGSFADKLRAGQHPGLPGHMPPPHSVEQMGQWSAAAGLNEWAAEGWAGTEEQEEQWANIAAMRHAQLQEQEKQQMLSSRRQPLPPQVGTKTEEERFQIDLQTALAQSLSTEGPPALPPLSSPDSTTTDTVASEELAFREQAGRGLVNEVGQYNCFLNVVIQSLWHLRGFRARLLTPAAGHHEHVGDPCVVCGLREIFLALDSRTPGPGEQKAVAPTPLRVALDAMFAGSQLFQESQMNDASEVLQVLFECMHKAFTADRKLVRGQANGYSHSVGSNGTLSDGEEYQDALPEQVDNVSGEESPPVSSQWECSGDGSPGVEACMVHQLFGLDVWEQMDCIHCGTRSRVLHYTTFFHNINASALRASKAMDETASMGHLLRSVDASHQLPCDEDVGGCKAPNVLQHYLRAAPHVFTTVLGWQNGQESVEDISATVDAIEVSIDVADIFEGLGRGFEHRLVSVVCYYGQHYHCFAYNQELAQWVMFDDSTVKLVGSWDDVAKACRRGHLQPQVLFYERCFIG